MPSAHVPAIVLSCAGGHYAPWTTLPRAILLIQEAHWAMLVTPKRRNSSGSDCTAAAHGKQPAPRSAHDDRQLLVRPALSLIIARAN